MAKIAFTEMLDRLSSVRPGIPLWISIISDRIGNHYANLWTYSDKEAPVAFIKRVISWAEEAWDDPDNESPADYATAILKRILSQSGDHVDVALEACPLADVSRDGHVRLTLVVSYEEIGAGIWDIGKDSGCCVIRKADIDQEGA